MYPELKIYKEVIDKEKGNKVYLLDVNEVIYYARADNSLIELDHKDDYQCKCPDCEKDGYLKPKLFIRKSDLLGHCFHCGLVLMNVTDELKHTVPVTTKNAFVFTGLAVMDPNPYIGSEDLSEDDLDWLETSRLKKSRWKVYYNFKLLVKQLGFKKSSNGDILIPFSFNDQLLYCQTYFKFPKDLKYWNPPIKSKPFLLLKRGDSKKYAIVEGAFDAVAAWQLYPNHSIIALIGSTATEYHIALLKFLIPEEIKIHLDETRLSEKLLTRLMAHIDYADYSIVPSKGDDPEEYLLNLLNPLKTSVDYSVD